MKEEYVIIITNYPDKDSAKCIARLLVEQRLAACAQMFPIESVYAWKEEIYNEQEVMLFIKSKGTLYDKIAKTIRENHSYEVPEIVQIPIVNGLPEYLRWIADNTEDNNDDG